MARGKRSATEAATADANEISAPRRRSTRQSAQGGGEKKPSYRDSSPEPEPRAAKKRRVSGAQTASSDVKGATRKGSKRSSAKTVAATKKKPATTDDSVDGEASRAPSSSGKAKKPKPAAESSVDESRGGRALSEGLDINLIPDRNPDVVRHDGEWYWLLKAEPETRLENGIDVRFSIDDLRAKTQPEPWDGESAVQRFGVRPC
jgi:hypothetical protein